MEVIILFKDRSAQVAVASIQQRSDPRSLHENLIGEVQYKIVSWLSLKSEKNPVHKVGYPSIVPPFLLHPHAPYEPIVPCVMTVESRITNLFAAAPAQSDRGKIHWPLITKQSASRNQHSLRHKHEYSRQWYEYRHFCCCFYV